MQIFTALLKGPDLESELVDGSPSRLPNIALALRLTTAKPPLNLMAKQPRSDDAIADTGYDSENLRNPTLSIIRIDWYKNTGTWSKMYLPDLNILAL